MKYRSLLRVIARQIALVFVLFFVIQGEALSHEAVAATRWRRRTRAVAADIPAEVQRAGGDFRLVKRRRKALAPVARSRQEAQASKVEAVTRRIGRAVPARTRLNANKPRRTRSRVIRLISRTCSRVIRLISRTRSRVARVMDRTRSKVAKVMGRTRSRVARITGKTRNRTVRITDRMRNRVARMLQITTQIPTEPPAPTAPGTAAARLVLGAATTPDWRAAGWRGDGCNGRQPSCAINAHHGPG